MSADTKKLSDQLEAATKARNNRHQLLTEMKQNFGSLVSDMADELHMIAKQLKGQTKLLSKNGNSDVVNETSNAAECSVVGKCDAHMIIQGERNSDRSTAEDSGKLNHANTEGSSQHSARKLNEAAKEKLLAESSLDESDGTKLSLPEIGHRMKKKLKKRKLKKEFTANDSTDYTSSSSSSPNEKKVQDNGQSQKSIISQQINELCKLSDSAPNGLTKDACLLNADSQTVGLASSGEVEIGVKTELFSQSSQMDSRAPANQLRPQPQQGATDANSMQNKAEDESSLHGDALSPVTERDSDSIDNDGINTDEEDDDDIRR